MADQYVRPYLDSSVWLGWIKGEESNGIHRGKVVEHILRHSEAGVYPIYISALTLAEVHRTASHATLSSPEDDKILSYFEREHIQVVDVDRLIGEEANKLCRQFGLKPCDAIHLACAIRADCDYLLTWDDRFTKARPSGIIVATPEMRGQQFLDV